MSEERQPNAELREKMQKFYEANRSDADIFFPSWWNEERVAAFASSIQAEGGQEIERLKETLAFADKRFKHVYERAEAAEFSAKSLSDSLLAAEQRLAEATKERDQLLEAARLNAMSHDARKERISELTEQLAKARAQSLKIAGEMAAPMIEEAHTRGMREAAELVVDVLKNHWPLLECDHEKKRDIARCSCANFEAYWRASVGEAIEAWAEHVDTELESRLRGRLRLPAIERASDARKEKA